MFARIRDEENWTKDLIVSTAPRSQPAGAALLPAHKFMQAFLLAACPARLCNF
jgi:hypothetical protein